MKLIEKPSYFLYSFVLTLYVVFLVSGLDVLLSYFNLVRFKPHIFFSGLLGFLLLPYMGFAKFFVQKFSGLLVWSFFFLVLLICQPSGLGDSNNELLRHLFFLIFLILNVFLLDIEFYREKFLVILQLALVSLVMFLVVEFFFRFPFSLHSARSAFFYLNPNGAGEALVLIYLVCLNNPKHKIINNELLGAFTSLGLVCTSSRSAILIFALITIYLLISKVLNFKKYFRDLVICLSLFYSVLFIPTMFDLVPSTMFDFGPSAMFDLGPSTMFDIEHPLDQKAEDYSHLATNRIKNDFSSQHRIQLAIEGLKTIANEKIIFGKGVGYSKKGEQRTHNLYIEVWIQFGIFSLAIIGFLYYFLLVNATSSVALLAPIGIVLFGMFDHNGIFQSKVMIVVMAFCITNRQNWIAKKEEVLARD